jgi:small subunit ribosomal protein S5
MQRNMHQRRFDNRVTEPEIKEFEEKVVRVSRVSKKTSGGNRMGFSVVVVVGDRKGRVGVGLGKAADVQSSVRKGVTYAKKHLIDVPMVGNTIPHEVFIKLGAARLIMRPASPGTGVIAGGAVRAVVEAAGIRDILTKVLGTSNKASNVYAAIEALQALKAGNKNTETNNEETVEIVKEPKIEGKEDKPIKKTTNKQESSANKEVKAKKSTKSSEEGK